MKNISLVYDDKDGMALAKLKRECGARSWEAFFLHATGIRKLPKSD